MYPWLTIAASKQYTGLSLCLVHNELNVVSLYFVSWLQSCRVHIHRWRIVRFQRKLEDENSSHTTSSDMDCGDAQNVIDDSSTNDGAHQDPTSRDITLRAGTRFLMVRRNARGRRIVTPSRYRHIHWRVWGAIVIPYIVISCTLETIFFL